VIYQQEDSLTDWKIVRERASETRPRTGRLSMSEGESQNQNWTRPGPDWAAHTQGGQELLDWSTVVEERKSNVCVCEDGLERPL